ncbi:hypothetical protein I7I53_11045 [Histoplasma capsulatum var. duboisii H88]|uniref:Uncharacterized protein n=1 Tax=Ajellomyces capsulatus (strain H88) TaxID=544711 RepID=A0A8A1L8E8_AJEC8|nr:hypothetical protein I7I53_11045 [Histoplasma capsulatum var. duboisii H88]
MSSMLLESNCSQVMLILSFLIPINYNVYILILIANYLPSRRCNKGFLNRRKQFHLDECEYKDRIILCSKNILNGKKECHWGKRISGYN